MRNQKSTAVAPVGARTVDFLSLKVQSSERTFIDKIFALADYYVSDRITEHSCHIYDIYNYIAVMH